MYVDFMIANFQYILGIIEKKFKLHQLKFSHVWDSFSGKRESSFGIVSDIFISGRFR